MGIGTVLAVSETIEFPISGLKPTKFVPSSTGTPRLTTQAGLKTRMWSPLMANDPQELNLARAKFSDLRIIDVIRAAKLRRDGQWCRHKNE